MDNTRSASFAQVPCPLDTAEIRALISSGASLHWLKPAEKRPVEANWTDAPRYDEDLLRAKYRDGFNIGFRPGSLSLLDGTRYLHVIDLDIRRPEYADEAWNRLLEMVPVAQGLPSVISGSGGKSRHIYFVSKEPFTTRNLAKSEGFDMVFDLVKKREVKKRHWEIDLCGTGKNVVLPPSTHPDTGQPYRWERPLELEFLALMELPAAAFRKEEHRSNATSVDWELERPKVLNALEAITDAEDRDEWVQIGMALHSASGGSDDGFTMWCDWSEQSEKFDETVSARTWDSFKGEGATLGTLYHIAKGYGYVVPGRRSIEITADDFEDLPAPGPDAPILVHRQHYDHHHAFVTVGGKTRVLKHGVKDLELYPDHELRKLYSNRKVNVRDEKGVVTAKEAYPLWTTWENRRTYEGLIFRPSGNVPTGFYNLWRGWSVAPDPNASCDLFLNHLRDVICSGNEDHYSWLIRWLAQMIQKPEVKPGTAVVLRGKKGTGKDTVGEYVGALFTRNHIKASSSANIVGHFNGHLAEALLLHVEEGFWAGDKKAQGILQTLITSPTIAIERKGIDVVQMDNFLRLMITSNEDWIVPASSDERRYFVLDVSDHRMQQEDYFKLIYAERDSGGAEALLHYLLNVDLTGFNPRKPPETEGLMRQKLESLKGVDSWWYDELLNGDLVDEFVDDFDGAATGWDGGPVTVTVSRLYERYCDFLRKRQYDGAPKRRQDMAKRLMELIGRRDITDSRRTLNEKRERTYTLPSRVRCQEAFERTLGEHVPWGD